MAKFFIDRPVFAWVIALFILLAGILAIPNLPISQYPQIAPPTIIVNAVYPGGSAQTVDESVTSLIEQEMNGAENMLYIESQSQSDGQTQVSVTFKNGTNPELAAVDVQNRLKRIEARLPQAVVQQGVTITRARSNLLMFVNLRATNGDVSPVALGDYLARNVINEIKRIPGVGVVQLFGTERAMRVWVDPDKLVNRTCSRYRQGGNCRAILWLCCASERQADCRDRHSADPHCQCAANGRAGTREDERTEKILPAGRRVRHPL